MVASSSKGTIGFTTAGGPVVDEDEGIGELLLGSAGAREVIMNFLVFFFFFMIASVPFISYAFASGGMQWIIVLLIITILALYIATTLRRGLQPVEKPERVVTGDFYTGDLARLTDSVKRGAEGYSYSQQVIREQIAEAIIHRIRLGRGITHEQMKKVMDDNLTTVVGDEEIMQFIQSNKKEAEGWSDKVSGRKRQGRADGERFLDEIEQILEKAEVWN